MGDFSGFHQRGENVANFAEGSSLGANSIKTGWPLGEGVCKAYEKIASRVSLSEAAKRCKTSIGSFGNVMINRDWLSGHRLPRYATALETTAEQLFIDSGFGDFVDVLRGIEMTHGRARIVVPAAVKSWGIEELPHDGTRAGFDFQAECVLCHQKEAKHYKALPGPNIILKHFQRDGWTLSRRGNVCGECMEKQRSKRTGQEVSVYGRKRGRVPGMNTVMAMALEEAGVVDLGRVEPVEQRRDALLKVALNTPPKTQKQIKNGAANGEVGKEAESVMNGQTKMTEMSASMMRALLRVGPLLEANFDSNKGRYLNGYSDERIAQELGVSKQLVVDAREMEFGVLKVDEAAQALADDIQALNALVAEKESEWQRVVSNVDREINDLKVQAREMKTRLDKLLA